MAKKTKTKPKAAAKRKSKVAKAASRSRKPAKTGSVSKPKARAAKQKAKPKKSAKKAPVVKKKAAPKKPVKKKAASSSAAAKKPAKKTAAPKTAAQNAAAKPAPPAAKPSGASRKSTSPKKGVSTPPKGSKILKREFLMGVAQAVKDAVEPLLHAAKGREITGQATSGDATFHIDAVAEKALLTYLRDARKPVAYYSEDAGYTTFTSGQPEHLLVVDPIDGTRSAKSGFESCVVCVASTRIIERPHIGDVDNAVILELAGPRAFYAERGKGCRIYADGSFKKPKLSTNTDLEMLTWTMTVPARPAELVFPTAAKLIDLSSLKGGFFACNSTSYSLTRLVTQQVDACIDIANRYYRDIADAVEDMFINAGRGNVLGIAPYDLAASLLIAEESGCVVTDAYGKRLHDVMLLDGAVTNMRSMIAASSPQLHEMLMEYFDTRIKQLEHLMNRRSQLMQGR